MVRRWVAWRLQQLATRIYSGERYEHVEIVDEYGIRRYSADINGDDYSHGIDNTFTQLPDGWKFHEWIDGQQWC